MVVKKKNLFIIYSLVFCLSIPLFIYWLYTILSKDLYNPQDYEDNPQLKNIVTALNNGKWFKIQHISKIQDKRVTDICLKSLKHKLTFRKAIKLIINDPFNEGNWSLLLFNPKVIFMSYRSFAATELGIIGDKKAVQPLIEALKDADSGVKHNAATALGKIGDRRAIQPLIKAFTSSPSSFDLTSYAQAIASFDDKKGTEILFKAFENKNSNIHYAAIITFREKKDKRAIPYLIKSLNVPQKYIRSMAAHVLGIYQARQAVTPLIKRLSDTDLEVREEATAALGKIGDSRAAQPIINALESKQRTIFWWKVVDALSHFTDSKTVDLLIKHLNSPDPYIRHTMIHALGILGNPKATLPLIKMLDKQRDKYMIAEALGNIKDKRATEPLIKLLKCDKSFTRSSAARALGKIGDQKAVPHLLAALHDKDISTRQSSAVALGKLKANIALNQLLKMLQDEDFHIRYSAACALGFLGNPQATDVLTTLLQTEENEDVIFATQKAIQKLAKTANSK